MWEVFNEGKQRMARSVSLRHKIQPPKKLDLEYRQKKSQTQIRELSPNVEIRASLRVLRDIPICLCNFICIWNTRDCLRTAFLLAETYCRLPHTLPPTQSPALWCTTCFHTMWWCDSPIENCRQAGADVFFPNQNIKSHIIFPGLSYTKAGQQRGRTWTISAQLFVFGPSTQYFHTKKDISRFRIMADGVVKMVSL